MFMDGEYIGKKIIRCLFHILNEMQGHKSKKDSIVHKAESEKSNLSVSGAI